MLEIVQNISNVLNIHYTRQKELGHTVNCAKNLHKRETFYSITWRWDIADANTLCLKQMINYYDEYKTIVLGVQDVAKENVDKYGILDIKHAYRCSSNFSY